MERTISAPGKLFLSGEYAVLWGGVGRVLAVGPRLQAAARRRPDRTVDVLLEEGRLTGVATPAGVRWSGEVPPGFLFVARTLDQVFRLLGGERTGLALAVQPSRRHQGAKLGEGGSARACVLAAEAARSCLGGQFDALKLALVAHADAQGGRGSGADVAASFAGGLIRYRRFVVSELLTASTRPGFALALEAAPAVDLLRAPAPELPMLYAYSGQPASTPELIAQVERDTSAADRRRFVAASDAASEALEAALVKADIPLVRSSMRELQERIWWLGSTGPSRKSQLRHEGVERILQIAETFGVPGKQSGAGGGDGCILVAPDADAARAATDALKSRGFFTARVHPEEGLRGEPVPAPELLRWLGS